MSGNGTLPLVRVIIPVYNTEKYLDECIASVLKQDYHNIEIMLIDDGSLDDSPAICECYAAKYENIQVIHQENQGPGIARNRGMESTDAKYLMFVDSDDCLYGNSAVRKLVVKAEEENADIVTGNSRRFGVSGMGRISRHHLRSGSYTRTVDFRFRGFLTEDCMISEYGKLYRTAFLRDNCLVHIRCHSMEDKLFNMMCCACEPVYGFVQECVYLYRVREGSITDQYKDRVEELADSWIFVAETFWNYLEQMGLEEEYGDLLAFHLFCGIFTIGRQPLKSCGMAGRGIKTAVKQLKAYGEYPLVKKALTDLANGKYLKEVSDVLKKTFVRAASVLYCLRAYRLLAWGIVIFRGLGTEKRMSRLTSLSCEPWN